MKTWNYKEITKKAEDEITSLMKGNYRDWAYGVFIGWKYLTMGWMNDGDVERLEELTKREST